MKYEFHVGDYVENNYGKVGYINSVKYTKSNKGVFYDIEIVYYNADIVGVFHGDQSLIQDHFKRIGQYDFTKKDEGKIEPLCEEYTKSFPICTTTTDENGLEWRNIDIGAVEKKINELVEAVNRLEEEINEMGQS